LNITLAFGRRRATLREVVTAAPPPYRTYFFRLALALVVTCATKLETRAQSRPIDKAREERQQVLPQGGGEESAEDREGSAPAPESPDPTPFGVDLSAIRLIAHQDRTDPGVAPGPSPIEVDPEIATPAAVAGLLEGYLGKPLSMALLAELAKDLIHTWRDEHYPIVDVYFPEQNVTAGRVQVVVREAVLGQVRINDTVHTDPAHLGRNVRLGPGDRIDRRILEADLDWLNRNPIRQVNLIYERGETDGTSDVVLDTLEEKPLSAYVGFGNTGVPLTGENEWSTGLQWLNPFGAEQSLGYHFGSNLEFDRLESHTALYRLFLPWRHELRLLGAAVFSDVPGNPTDPVPIDLGGENLQASIDYVVPLPRPGGFRALRHELLFGLDWKSTNTDLIFGGLNAIASSAAVFQFRVGHEATWRDRLGSTRTALVSVWSPGEVLRHNDDASFSALREGATASYWYGYAELERSLDLPFGMQFVARGRGHVTGDRLLSTEQLLAGGYLTVRGFDENLVRGDSGGLLNLEVHSPAFSLLSRLPSADEGKAAFAEEWRLLAFYDGAFLRNSDPLPGEVSPALHSAGVGATCRIAERAFLRAAYGWILDTHGVPAEFVDRGRLHFGMTVSY
jgi:hemolysin activation/secretion protein